MDYHLSSLITVLTLILLFGVAFHVGKAREKYKIVQTSVFQENQIVSCTKIIWG